MGPRKSLDGHSSAKSVSLKNKLDLPKKCQQEREIDFAELGDGTLVEVVEDPGDPNRTRLAFFKNGRVCFADRLVHCGESLAPVRRTAVGFSDVKLPRGVMPYGSVSNLIYMISFFIMRVIDVRQEYLVVLSAFVLYTWVADRLPPAVYLSVIGLPQSGKTTLLEVLSLICRRPLFVSDISEAALNRVCRRFSPTLLIDEADWNSSKAATLRRQLRAGTGPSSRALRVRESTSSFGPKVICSLEPSSDSALNSRCLQIIMSEVTSHKRVKPRDPQIIQWADTLQQQLLRFRFNSYRKIQPAIVPGAEKLRPRSQDLLSSLAAPLLRCKLWREGLREYIEVYHDPATRESLGTRQDAVLAVVFELVHQPRAQSVRVKVLAQAANVLLLRLGERVTLTDKAAGTMLSSFGFESKNRTNQGWVLWLDSRTQERVHQLFETHGITHLQNGDLERYAESCPTCQTLVSASNSDAAPRRG